MPLARCIPDFTRRSLLLCAAGFRARASAEGAPEGREIANDRVSLSVQQKGGVFRRFHLADDPGRRSPLSSTHGHFVCADAFGPPSKEEREAGFPQHGEAHHQQWSVDAAVRSGVMQTFSCSAKLPLAGERFSRTLRLVDGEQVIYVRSSLENLTPIDRPVIWQEHATLGAPFLSPGDTFIDLSARRSLTRPLREGRFKPGEEFTWPMAPAPDGSHINLRETPKGLTGSSITTHLMPREGLAYATAINLSERLAIGWVFLGSSFPWLQNWESYTAPGALERGLEFGLTAFGSPRREVVSAGRLMDTPLYQWLPAKGKIEASFLMFLARTPEGMRGVDRATLDRGTLLVEDRKNGRQLSLKASLDW